jgi:mannosyltransferase OCH1-like enzyme
VVQYWHNLYALPDDVAECLQSWNRLEKDGFEIKMFDDGSARRFIAANFEPSHVIAFDRCYHAAMRCDYFRLCYILRRGGFYVDADEVYKGTGCESLFQDTKAKLQPLCYDLSINQMVPPEEFLCDSTFPSNRIFYVNNNPIIAPPGHAVIDMALRRATQLLLQDSERPEIQSTTGPGNLSASLVRHVTCLQTSLATWDFTLLRRWNNISECRWFLSYRNDERNWRLANATGRA